MSSSTVTAPAQYGTSVGRAGGIFVAHWGATMSLNTFVQVTKIKGNRVYYRPVRQTIVRVGEYLAGDEVPQIDAFKGEERFSVLRQDESGAFYFKDNPNFCRRDGFRVYFRQWNGKPCYFNHCD